MPDDHLAERREALRVEPRVVAVVDEELRRARIRRASLGKRDEAALVALLDRDRR